MGYGSTSKGGGGSGNAGGGKKKSGGRKQKSRNFKVKEKKTAAASAAAAAATTTPAFSVREPNPAERARLLAARRRGEQLLTAANVRRRKPVNGTSAGGRVLGGNNNSLSEGGSAAVADDDFGIVTTAPTTAIALDHLLAQQQEMQQSSSEREARRSFLAKQEAKMEDVRRRREETIRAKRKAAEREQEQHFARKVAMAKQQWDALAARLDGDEGEKESLGDIRRLLEVVLRNAATKSDPKYKLLKTSNRNLWTRLLRFREVVAILENGAGFERRVVGTNTQIETEALRIEMERDRINVEISQALNESNRQDTIASLIADLDALEIAAANQQQLAGVAAEEARDFELGHAGAGEDRLGVKRILAILGAVESW
mmetsp:Transcript_19302/g.42004  ORF Transcript_19302/g.42004 Transcript_19302/m.42004 type:complete len:372 (+) Transcript_19302:112-1227(+)